MTVIRRIAIVEDEEIILADMARTLRKGGHEIVGTASSASAALQVARTTEPDLIVMDVRVHGRADGIEAARRIREFSDVPILFVTAHASALALGPDDLGGRYATLAKPFSPSELNNAVRAILDGSVRSAPAR